MHEYITVAEAVRESGRSLSSVRRALKKVPRESVRRQGKKYVYERAALFKELEVEIQPEPLAPSPTNSPQVHADSMESQWRETLLAQIATQQRIIDELLERQRETNILLNQRQITVQEPAPVGKTAAEKRRENLVLFIVLGVFLLLILAAVWFSWRP